MSAARRRPARAPRWADLEPQLQQLLTLKKLSKSSAKAAGSLADACVAYISSLGVAAPDTQSDDPRLQAAAPLLAKVLAHVLNLARELGQNGDAASVDVALYAALSWLDSDALGIKKINTTDLFAQVFSATTGLLPAMAAFCAWLTPLLDQPQANIVKAFNLMKVFEVYQHALVSRPADSVLQSPLLASASAPIYSACLAILRHQPPAAAARAGDFNPATECSRVKQMAICIVRVVSFLCHTLVNADTQVVQAVLADTVLGSPDMPQLLLAQLAVDVGCCWHKLQQGQSELKAPRKVPLRGFGVSSSASGSSASASSGSASSTGSTGSSTGNSSASGSSSSSRIRAAASAERQRQLLSVDVEPSHMQLLQHLGVVVQLPPVEGMSIKGYQDQREGGVATQGFHPSQACEALIQTVRLLRLITEGRSSATGTSSSTSSTSSSGGSDSAQTVLSTPTLCKLVRVLAEALLLTSAQQQVYVTLVLSTTVSDCMGALLLRCSNLNSFGLVRGDLVAVPAPDSEASNTALHLLRLWLHHVVPALLYGYKHAPYSSVAANKQAAMLKLMQTTLGLTVCQCMESAFGGRTTTDSWQELATTDQAAIRALIQQQPLQSLLALELAVRYHSSGTRQGNVVASGPTVTEEQLSLSLALFGVPAFSPDAVSSHELPVGLLSPQLIAAAAADNPPGLRQRLLSLLATGLKLAMLQAEVAPAEDTGPGVLMAGLVASICRCFNAFSSSCADLLADAPPAAQAQLRQELVAMMGRLLHAAGRVQQLLYERARSEPASGSIASQLLARVVYVSSGGHWALLVRLQDLQVLTEVLDCSRSALVSMQQGRQLPEGVVQPLLQQQSELIELHAPFSRQVQVLSSCLLAEEHGSPPSDAGWRQQVPELLDEGEAVAVKLQAYGAALAALYPRNYMCNNLKCREMDHETESAAATKVCSQCKQARYCCAPCQQANWRGLHNAACKRLQAEAAAAAGSS